VSGYAIVGGAPRSVELEFDSNGFIQYIGLAAPGTAVGTAAWQIRKFSYDGYNNITSILYANGRPDYDQVWTGRAGLSYS
jgi:hypothetical protein